ncbi:hypothetical protein M5X17_27495 [Paenibacillus alvei]|uniref:hypothetical protein n=1 Tax=Paenibacillus alvei TaxID=44250 RepID=UPI002282081F|nr:hypothetical protein [Paenibacillus alvei]MCY9737450.1 hypothetical protein [Paenibacillus alvei]
MNKQTIKKYAFGFGCFTAGALLTLSTSTYAGSSLKDIKAYLSESTPIVVDGQKSNLSSINYKNTTYLPLRDTASLVGKVVDYKDGVIKMNSTDTKTPTNQTESPKTEQKESTKDNTKETVKFKTVKNETFSKSDSIDTGRFVYSLENVKNENGKISYDIKVKVKDGYVAEKDSFFLSSWVSDLKGNSTVSMNSVYRKLDKFQGEKIFNFSSELPEGAQVSSVVINTHTDEYEERIEESKWAL